MGNRKVVASDRTIDIFSGKTKLEESQVEEVIDDAPKTGESIEVSAERWRNNCFFTAEHLSKSFMTNLHGGDSKFRLTMKDGLMLLERFAMDYTGKVAASWTGVMFRTGDLYELTSVLVTASKARQAGK